MSDQVLFETYELNSFGYVQEAVTTAKTTWSLESWIEEQSLRNIESSLGVAPGDLRIRVDHATWLLRAAKEICRFDRKNDQLDQATLDLIDCLEVIQKRVENGCKEDLLALISIRGVGRVRARTLADHGYRTPLEICSITKRSQQKLADERGWSPQLVRSIIAAADRAIQVRR
jgi:helicase